MKETEKKIQDKFIELLSSTPIEDITVLLLCKSLNIKRQTFYYHYQSIYDLIYSIFYSKRIDVDENLSFEKNIEVLQAFFIKNRVLCKGIESSFASEILLEFCSSFVFRLIRTLGKNIANVNEVAKFYSKPIAQIIIENYQHDNFSMDATKEIIKSNYLSLLRIINT